MVRGAPEKERGRDARGVSAEIDKCWAFARVNLPGLSDAEFWRLTPREFVLLREEWERKERNSAINVAALMATICNASGSYYRSFSVNDFMPPEPGSEGPDLDAAFDILRHLKQD